MDRRILLAFLFLSLLLQPVFTPAPYRPSGMKYVTEAGIGPAEDGDGREIAVSVRVGGNVCTGTGTSLPDAVKTLEAQLGAGLFFRTAGAWVFSARLTGEERGEAISALLSDRETAARCRVFLTEDDPAEILNAGGDLAARTEAAPDVHLMTTLRDVAEGQTAQGLFFDRLRLSEGGCTIGGALSFDGTRLGEEETAVLALLRHGWKGKVLDCPSGVGTVTAEEKNGKIRGNAVLLAGEDPDAFTSEAERRIRMRLAALGYDCEVKLTRAENGTVLP